MKRSRRQNAIKRCDDAFSRDPEPFREKWIREHGRRRYEELERKSWRVVRSSIDDIEVLAKSFNDMTERVDEPAEIAES